MTSRISTCLLSILATTAADGCSNQQQQRVAYYQPITPLFQQGATPEGPAAGPRRWERGFTWNLSGWGLNQPSAGRGVPPSRFKTRLTM